MNAKDLEAHLDDAITEMEEKYGIPLYGDLTKRGARKCGTCIHFKRHPAFKASGVCNRSWRKYLPIRRLKTTRDWCWKWVPDMSKI
ncbi:hypothetical protein [Pseudolabrys sp.]|uniref:hypothetical protein n=1 Tax=Pseudolabrys sp. TaxID=1960880 RepID=UPI003D0FCFA0